MGRSQLARTDASELAELESVIDRTLRESFVELGRALARIRDERLYKTAGFDRFEDYCRERWDFGLNYAYKQMAASDAVCTIVQKGLPAPANEAQVRELLKLPEGREEAWAEAVETAPDGKVTARHVAAVVEARLRPPEDDAEEPAVDDPAGVQEPDVEPAADTIPEQVPDAQASTAPCSSRGASDSDDAPAEQCAPEQPDGAQDIEPDPVSPLPNKCQGCGLTENIGCACCDATIRKFLDLKPEDQARFLLAVGAVLVAELERLRDTRQASGVRPYDAARGSLSRPNRTRGEAMMALILDGGEVAMLRLGLDWNSSEADLKQAQKTAAFTNHPDRGGSAETMARINRDCDLLRPWFAGGA